MAVQNYLAAPQAVINEIIKVPNMPGYVQESNAMGEYLKGLPQSIYDEGMQALAEKGLNTPIRFETPFGSSVDNALQHNQQSLLMTGLLQQVLGDDTEITNVQSANRLLREASGANARIQNFNDLYKDLKPADNLRLYDVLDKFRSGYNEEAQRFEFNPIITITDSYYQPLEGQNDLSEIFQKAISDAGYRENNTSLPTILEDKGMMQQFAQKFKSNIASLEKLRNEIFIKDNNGNEVSLNENHPFYRNIANNFARQLQATYQGNIRNTEYTSKLYNEIRKNSIRFINNLFDSNISTSNTTKLTYSKAPGKLETFGGSSLFNTTGPSERGLEMTGQKRYNPDDLETYPVQLTKKLDGVIEKNPTEYGFVEDKNGNLVKTVGDKEIYLYRKDGNKHISIQWVRLPDTQNFINLQPPTYITEPKEKNIFYERDGLFNTLVEVGAIKPEELERIVPNTEGINYNIVTPIDKPQDRTTAITLYNNAQPDEKLRINEIKDVVGMTLQYNPFYNIYEMELTYKDNTVETRALEIPETSTSGAHNNFTSFVTKDLDVKLSDLRFDQVSPNLEVSVHTDGVDYNNILLTQPDAMSNLSKLPVYNEESGTNKTVVYKHKEDTIEVIKTEDGLYTIQVPVIDKTETGNDINTVKNDDFSIVEIEGVKYAIYKRNTPNSVNNLIMELIRSKEEKEK